jgi:hypothetical protein
MCGSCGSCMMYSATPAVFLRRLFHRRQHIREPMAALCRNRHKTMLYGIASALLLSSSGCLPAISNNFESARMPASGALEIQGNSSLYYGELNENRGQGWGFRTIQTGGSLAYGFSAKWRLKARFEHVYLIDEAGLFDRQALQPGTSAVYLEANVKYGWKHRGRKFRYAALALPIGCVVYPGGQYWSVAPTAFATYSPNDQFEIGLNGKAYFWLNHTPPIPWTNLSIGFGLSNDLKKWVFRPEIGYDFYNLSVGLGYAYTFHQRAATTRKRH